MEKSLWSMAVPDVLDRFRLNAGMLMKNAVQDVLGFSAVLSEGSGKVLIARCMGEYKNYSVVGRIGDPAVKGQQILAEGNSYLIRNYDLSKRTRNPIRKGNVLSRYQGLFPFSLIDLVPPREFSINRGRSRVPIWDVSISDKEDVLLECLDSLRFTKDEEFYLREH